MEALAARAFEEGIDGWRVSKERRGAGRTGRWRWREWDGRRLIAERGGRHERMRRQGVDREREKMNTEGLKKGGESMDGYWHPHAGEGWNNGVMWPLDWPWAAWGPAEEQISLTLPRLQGRRSRSRERIIFDALNGKQREKKNILTPPLISSAHTTSRHGLSLCERERESGRDAHIFMLSHQRSDIRKLAHSTSLMTTDYLWPLRLLLFFIFWCHRTKDKPPAIHVLWTSWLVSIMSDQGSHCCCELAGFPSRGIKSVCR